MNFTIQFIQASKKGDLSQVKKLIKNTANTHSQNDLAFRWAAEFGQLEVVKYLIEDHGANVHAYDELALRSAAHNGHLEVVKYLVAEGGANVHADNDKTLHWAAYQGHLEVVKYLVEDRGVNVHAEDDNALRWAAHKGHLHVMKYLKSYIVSQFTKRHIDKQNVLYASEQYKLPFEIQQLISTYV